MLKTIRRFAIMLIVISGCAYADIYTYDELDRLTAVAYPDGGSQTYSYDAAGNLLSAISTPPVGSNYTLAVNLSGVGSGTVSSVPAGISCGSTCNESFPKGASVTLTATPANGSNFASWGGACTGTGVCTLNMDAAKSVTATFAPITYILNVSKSGTGAGTVSSSPTGISCGSTCSIPFNSGASVTLTATPAAGSTFTSWSGACTGAGNCVVTMSAAQNVTATFAQSSTTAPVCTLTANPAIITVGSSSTLTASCNQAVTSYTWTGGTCAGTTAATCTVTPSVTTVYTVAGTNAGGTSTADSKTVTVTSPSTLQPNADGTVFDPKTGLTWMRCSMGQVWSGSTCTGTASTYTFDQANALTGATTFAGKSDWRVPNIRELQTIVDRSVYSPAIDSAAFPNTPGSTFWSGSPGVGYSSYAWIVKFDYGYADYYYGIRSDSNAVRLVRGGQSFGSLLGITRPTSDYVDNGNGTVTHTPTNLTWQRCTQGQTWTGSTCSGAATSFTFDQAKALTGSTTFAGQSDWRLPTEDELLSLVDYSIAYPGPTINSSVFPVTPGSDFWSGSPYASSPYDAWLVYFSNGYAHYNDRYSSLAVRLVRGGQSLGSFALIVSKSGTGTGTVSSVPVGISCGSTCSASFNSGSSVTLTATPASGSTFTGWSGVCTGTGSCTVSMTGAKSVTATFALSVAAPVCTLSANPASINAGGSSTLTATCSPAATSYTWTGGTCAGTTGATCSVAPTATTNYTVAGVNTGGAGTATSATVTVNACTYGLGTSSASLAATASTGNVGVTSTCAWAATSNASWISITSGASGSGNGTVAYTVAANTDTAARTGTLTIAGKTYTVTQAGATTAVPVCTLSTNPATINTGASATLTATCTPAATSYVWTGGTCAGTSAATCTVTPTATTTYTVAGVSAGGTGVAASATVTVTTANTGALQPNADGTVFDPKTGLTWMRCSMGQVWNGSTCTGTASTYTFDQANALTGTTTFAGQNDWRMPNIRELQTIVDRSVVTPAIDRVAFPNAPSSIFWSGSPGANNSSLAWYVSFGTGGADLLYGDRSNGNAVRLVRGGQSFGSLLGITRPTSDYVDNGNGTVTHTPTNLTWKRCAEGLTWTGSTCSGTAATYTFEQANALTGVTMFGGQSDWRVPTEDELVSLVDYSIAIPGPTINSSVFPATTSSLFWSGSPNANGSDLAWGVVFFYGYASSYYRSYNDAVRLVRGGQSLGSLALTISKSGTGTGTVSSVPVGISCGTTCSASFTSGTSVTLTTTPAMGSIFTGWSGACTGTGSCTVSMNAVKSVTATFALSVTAPVCTLSANPTSINAGASATLTATCSPAATSYTWTGGTCAGTTGATCTVSPTATTTYTVKGTNAGGAGAAASATVTVVSTAAPICTLTANPASITSGGSSTLTATCNPPATGYIWTGGTCAGTTGATCTVKPTATTTYSVQGSNAGGANQAASATVTVAATNVPSYTVPGTLGGDVFVLTAGNNYYGGAGNDTYIISPSTLRGGVTAKVIDSEGDNLVQLVDGTTITASNFYADAAQLTLSSGATVQILGASKFKYQVGANVLAGDTATVLTYSQFVSSLGASLSGTLPAAGTAGYVVPTVFTQATTPVPSVAGSSYTVSGTLGDDVLVPSGGNSYLGGGGNDTYIISPYTLSGAVTAKIVDSEGSNVIQLASGVMIASSTFYNNALQLTFSNGASVQVLGASGFSYQLSTNAPAGGTTASSLSYAQFAAVLGASVPAAGAPAVSGSIKLVLN